jgi:hypothetical protein
VPVAAPTSAGTTWRGPDRFEADGPPEGAIPPLFEYGRDNGECSVIGGFVVRDPALPRLDGVYLYADLCRSEVRGVLRLPDGTVAEGPLLGGLTGAPSSFGQDGEGRLYVLTLDGTVSRVAG